MGNFGKFYSDSAPFETRAMDLCYELGLVTSSVFSESNPSVLTLTLSKPGTDFELEFHFNPGSDTEKFWEQVANRLEISQVIDEVPTVDD